MLKDWNSCLMLLKMHLWNDSSEINFYDKHRDLYFKCRNTKADRHSVEDYFLYKFYLPTKKLAQPLWIVDAGANIGLASIDLAYNYPTATIIAIEMDRSNADLIKFNTNQKNLKIHLINKALWIDDKGVSFEGESADAFSICSNQNDLSVLTEAKFSESITINQILNTFKIPVIDYLKLDVEGAESELLLSKHDTEWLKKISHMKIELHGIPIILMQEFLETKDFSCSPDLEHWACLNAVKIVPHFNS